MSLYGNDIMNEAVFLSKDGKAFKDNIKAFIKDFNKENNAKLIGSFNSNLDKKFASAMKSKFGQNNTRVSALLVTTTTNQYGASTKSYERQFIVEKDNKFYSFKILIGGRISLSLFTTEESKDLDYPIDIAEYVMKNISDNYFIYINKSSIKLKECTGSFTHKDDLNKVVDYIESKYKGQYTAKVNILSKLSGTIKITKV